MADNFSGFGNSIDGPGSYAAAITPNDGGDLATSARALWIGTSGNIAVVPVGGGSPVIFKSISGWMPVRVARVMATGTTATDIVAVW
jgi:hypothetical protein